MTTYLSLAALVLALFLYARRTVRILSERIR